MFVSHVRFCRRNVLDGRTMIEQLSELERRSDPLTAELAGVWTSSYAVVRETCWLLVGQLVIIYPWRWLKPPTDRDPAAHTS